MIKIKQAKNLLADIILLTKLKIKVDKFTKERAKEGPWLKDIHLEYINTQAEKYLKEHGKDPDLEERFEKVFGSLSGYYFQRLGYHMGIR